MRTVNVAVVEPAAMKTVGVVAKTVDPGLLGSGTFSRKFGTKKSSPASGPEGLRGSESNPPLISSKRLGLVAVPPTLS